jgi:hypothetical protein
MYAEQKRKAEALNRLHQQLVQTMQILSMDLKFADEQLQKDKSNEQFWRRTVIRCVCALVEGTLSVIKNVVPETSGFFHVELTEDDMEVITELRIDKKDGLPKPAFLRPRENVKQTVKLFAKVHAIQFSIKYENQSFDDLCRTFELRNKLMHPKNSFDLEVKEDAYKASVNGWNWLNFALVDLLAESGKKVSQLSS